VRIAYAPNRGAPLDIDYGMEGRGERQPAAFFVHPEMMARYPANLITTERARGLHFFDDALPWNGGREGNAVLQDTAFSAKCRRGSLQRPVVPGTTVLMEIHGAQFSEHQPP
jgi:hypothetical protein